MEETLKPPRPARGILASLMPPNGTRRAVGSFAASAAAAAVFSVAAAVVSVQVMSADLGRAKQDIQEIKAAMVPLDRQVTTIVAARSAEAHRWDEIKTHLRAIEDTQNTILRALPRAWRDAATGQ